MQKTLSNSSAGVNTTRQQSTVVLPGSNNNLLSTATLQCNVEGVQNPLATVEWTLPSGYVVNRFKKEERFSIFYWPDFRFPNRHSSILSIEKLSYADAGMYSCYVSENGISDSDSIELQLQGMYIAVCQYIITYFFVNKIYTIIIMIYKYFSLCVYKIVQYIIK